MKIELGFTVEAHCREFYTDKKDENFILNFDIKTAEKFLSKFDSSDIYINDDMVRIKFVSTTAEETNNSFLIVDNQDLYVVLNRDQVIRDVMEGYKKLIILDKMSTILDFDFEAAVDII